MNDTVAADPPAVPAARKTPWLRVAMLLLGLAGSTLLVGLLVYHGVNDIAAAIATAGWGLVLIVALHCVPLLLDAQAWAVLFPRGCRPTLRAVFWMRWIGESVSTLLPAAQIGGDLVRARLAVTRGVPVSLAAGTILADVTVGVFTQILFTLSGIALLVHITHHDGLFGPALAGSLIALLGVGGFYVVQRVGIFGLIGAAASRLADSAGGQGLKVRGSALDEEVRGMYSRKAGIFGCAAWTMVSWAAGACEIWLALHVLGLPASYAHAYILESVNQGVRGAMFFVPGALGVQEGGYLVAGGMLGLAPDAALALALVRRVRELSFGIVGLIGWQWIEGRHFWQRRCPTAPG